MATEQTQLPQAGFNFGLTLTGLVQQLSSVSLPSTQGFIIRSKQGNNSTGLVYGYNSNLTNQTGASTDGMPLYPGDFSTILTNNPNGVYVLGTSGDIIAVAGS